MSLRVASLDYLGTVAARLRKDAVCTQQTEIDELLEEVSSTRCVTLVKYVCIIKSDHCACRVSNHVQ